MARSRHSLIAAVLAAGTLRLIRCNRCILLEEQSGCHLHKVTENLRVVILNSTEVHKPLVLTVFFIY